MKTVNCFNVPNGDTVHELSSTGIVKMTEESWNGIVEKYNLEKEYVEFESTHSKEYLWKSDGVTIKTQYNPEKSGFCGFVTVSADKPTVNEITQYLTENNIFGVQWT